MRNASNIDLTNKKTWTQQDGTVLRVKDLTSTHRANIIRILERTATARHAAAVDELEAMSERVLSHDEDGVITGLVREVLKELNGTDPIAELSRTPLMRKLRKLAAADAEAEWEFETLTEARTRIAADDD